MMMMTTMKDHGDLFHILLLDKVLSNFLAFLLTIPKKAKKDKEKKSIK